MLYKKYVYVNVGSNIKGAKKNNKKTQKWQYNFRQKIKQTVNTQKKVHVNESQISIYIIVTKLVTLITSKCV